MTEIEYLDLMSKETAKYYEISDPPQVDVIRFVDTDELDAIFRSCLDELGFGSNFLWYPEQDGEYNRAQYVCTMQYPVTERYAEDWGQEQKKLQYQWLVEFLIPCLENEGHGIRNIPSEAEFLDRYETEPFYPFAQVLIPETDGYNAEWNRLERVCPQQAPGAVVWDGMSIADWQSNRK